MMTATVTTTTMQMMVMRCSNVPAWQKVSQTHIEDTLRSSLTSCTASHEACRPLSVVLSRCSASTRTAPMPRPNLMGAILALAKEQQRNACPSQQHGSAFAPVLRGDPRVLRVHSSGCTNLHVRCGGSQATVQHASNDVCSWGVLCPNRHKSNSSNILPHRVREV